MNNKKIIAKGLIVSILLLNTPTDAMADVVENYKSSVMDEKENNKFEEFFNNLFDKFKKPREVIKVNKNIKVGTVLNITLEENEYVPNLDGNVDGYETIVVTTNGNKQLEKKDYDNLRTSGIPRIDLSNAKSEVIPYRAFSGAEHLISFKFPKGLKIIEEYSGSVTNSYNGAFAYCTNLEGELKLPDTLTEIGEYAFYNCTKLSGDLVIPSSIKEIGDEAFYGCTGFNGKLIIENGVKKIGGSAFEGCSGFIGDLAIPNSVTVMWDSVFKGCSGFNGNLTLPKSIKHINFKTFEGCSGLTGDLIIPNNINSIGSSAFKGCSGFNDILTISDSVTEIDENAFEGCSGFTGDLVIPNSVNYIGNYAFSECTGFNGSLILSNRIEYIGSYAFKNTNFTSDIIIPSSLGEIEVDTFAEINTINKLIVKIDQSDVLRNYKKYLIDNLPDTNQTIIDIPYNMDISNTWLEDTNKVIGKPIVESFVNGQKVKFTEDGLIERVSIHIPTKYKEKNIEVLRNSKPYDLPSINEEDKYVFNEIGNYKVKITTDAGNISIISFKIKNNKIEETIIEAVQSAEESRNAEDIAAARELVNSLPESIQKDELQNRLNEIAINQEFETKTATAYLDVYVKSENTLSLSLNTNNITFEDFSGVEDDEKLNAVNLTVHSSLPYKINAYLPVEIIGSKYGEEMDKSIFNIRANGENDYQTFENIETPIILLDDQDAGNEREHGIDLKLKGDIAHKKDIYKATVKFEVEQK